MRKKIKSILHDLKEVYDYKNPLSIMNFSGSFKIDLISGQVIYQGEDDSLKEVYEIKRSWFVSRIKELKGNLEDFEKAEILIESMKEKIVLIYKGERFESSKIFKPMFIFGE
jgi:hypothetical protein